MLIHLKQCIAQGGKQTQEKTNLKIFLKKKTRPECPHCDGNYHALALNMK